MRIAKPLLLAVIPLLLAAPRGDAQDDARVLTVATKEAPPFAMKSAGGRWTGMSIELWELAAARLGLRSEYREMGLQEMLDAVAAGEVDAAVAALTVTPEREERLDFTHPFHSTGLGIAVPAQGGSGGLAVLGAIFSLDFLKAIGTLVLVLLLSGLLVWAFERRANPEHFGGKTLAQGLGSAFWWSAVTMTMVGYGDKAPVTVGGRLVALVWMFASIIVIATFTGSIASSLTVDRLSSSIGGVEDLPGLRVAVVRGSTSESWMRGFAVRLQTVDDAQAALEQVARGDADAAVHDAPVLRYLVGERFGKRLAVLPRTPRRQDYAIALPPGSDLREPLNRTLLDLLQDERWDAIRARYLGER